MRAFREGFRELRQYPSALLGVAIIATLLVLSLYAVIAVPYDEAIRLWRGGEDIWLESPRNAQPRWTNLFLEKKLPETLSVGTGASLQSLSAQQQSVEISLGFEYAYDDFPSELTLFLTAKYAERSPHIKLSWRTPDGRVIALGDRSMKATERYGLSLDRRLERQLQGRPPEIGLFADPRARAPTVLKGRYELNLEGLLLEKDSEIEAKLVVYGKVQGLAGTDHRRRDLLIALLWGAPIALAFGFLAAVGTSVTSLFIAAVGAWYGRWVDAVIQRITEINLILPALAILIMIGTFYSRSIWVMMAAIIVLNIFGGSIKVYRAIFLQVKESPYIEAARAYGASNLRIVLRYMVPRIIPVLVPGFVTLIPSLVFLEASLAVLGLGDPVLPTWGKILNDASSNGALYKGYYYWVLGPSTFLMLTGFGFALVGFALDRIFNPRLRGL